MLKTYLLYTVISVGTVLVGVEAVNYAIDGHRYTFIKSGASANSKGQFGITHSWVTSNRKH